MDALVTQVHRNDRHDHHVEHVVKQQRDAHDAHYEASLHRRRVDLVLQRLRHIGGSAADERHRAGARSRLTSLNRLTSLTTVVLAGGTRSITDRTARGG